jgi:hypothetical protein
MEKGKDDEHHVVEVELEEDICVEAIEKRFPVGEDSALGLARRSGGIHDHMGLRGETVRRKVPFKEIWRKWIAAGKTTSPHEVRPARTKSRDSWTLMLITGQRFLRFLILKETPAAPRKTTEAILRL